MAYASLAKSMVVSLVGCYVYQTPEACSQLLHQPIPGSNLQVQNANIPHIWVT